MNSHERMQRESNLVAIIRKKLPEFAKACADDTELDLIHLCWPSREESPCDREKPKHTARRRENPVTESLQKQVPILNRTFAPEVPSSGSSASLEISAAGSNVRQAPQLGARLFLSVGTDSCQGTPSGVPHARN